MRSLGVFGTTKEAIKLVVDVLDDDKSSKVLSLNVLGGRGCGRLMWEGPRLRGNCGTIDSRDMIA